MTQGPQGQIGEQGMPGPMPKATPRPKQMGLNDVMGRLMHGDDWDNVKERQVRREEMMYPTPPPSPSRITLTAVGIVAAFLMVHAAVYAHLDMAIAITEAILSLAVTTIWCCLYLARR